MKYYSDLLKMGCFSRDDVCKLVGNYETASSLIKTYLQRGYIRVVKRNLFVVINLADNEPVLSKFQIGSKLTETAYISHHSAFEYYGRANQVAYKVTVSSNTRFAPFYFHGNTYARLPSHISEGIVSTLDNVRITDPERTLLDSIYDFEDDMGLEELLRCLSLVPSANENRLLAYLPLYNRQFLYQKTGYVLQHFKEELRLSDSFFTECASHIGNSIRYLSTKKEGKYNKVWQLIVPENLMAIISKGAFEDADV